MSEMVERVAKAIRDVLIAQSINADNPFGRMISGLCAEAAIAVMREPTDVMYLAALRITRSPDHGHVPDVVGGMAYRAMIDAALAAR